MLCCVVPCSLVLARCRSLSGLALAAPALAFMELKECDELRGVGLAPVGLQSLALGR